jgi:cyanophycin synthetase
MKIQQIRTIYGPNVFSHNPVLVMRPDLMELTGKESNEIPGFLERLLAALPRMYEHHSGKGYRGGFVERLQEGTWFGHIVEHVCLELTDWAGISAIAAKRSRPGRRGYSTWPSSSVPSQPYAGCSRSP